MIEISVSAINARAPYSVTLSSANSFQFVTHSNVYYTVGFVLDPTFIPDGVYQFYIVNDSHHNFNADPLVKETIYTSATPRIITREQEIVYSVYGLIIIAEKKNSL